MARPRAHKQRPRRSGSRAPSSRRKRRQPRAQDHEHHLTQGRRLWVLRISAVFAAPAIFFLLLEGILVLGGVGYPRSFFVASEQAGVLTTNMRFGWHYQQQALTEPYPCLVPADKPPGTIRVFILGESAAMGTPDPSFGFARVLEVMLPRYFPRHQFEVINVAMRGINSHVIVPISRECAGLEPDLFIVYMGNNELNGLYGPKTPLSFLGRHPGLIPAFHWIKQTHTGRLLRTVFGANPESRRRNKRPPTTEFFREHCTALDDPQRDYVYRDFRTNLERICRRGLEAGAGVVLSTVAVNLRDCPPLGSLHRADLTPAQQQQWSGHFKQGTQFESRGEMSQAISCYLEAAAIDDHYAELQFRLGRCRLAAGQIEAARHHLALGRDWDALQFRADSRLNGIIRGVAAEFSGSGLSLVDAEATLATSERCPDGIPGEEFFYEHVHLRFDGDYEVARAMLPAILGRLRERGVTPTDSVEIPTREECARQLAFTAWDEVNTAAAMVQLTANPPFTQQLEHAERQARAERAVSAVTDRIDQAFIDQVIQAYNEAIRARPDDWSLRYNLGAFLHQLGRSQEAATHFDYVVRVLPHVSPYRVLFGYALGKAGRPDQAIQQFREALKRTPRYKPARDGLNWARGMKQGAARGR
jgi:tetratricopeptide (TPR) repeat protein